MREPPTTGMPLLPAVVIGCCGGLNLAVGCWALLTHPAINSDFRGLWSFAKFARNHASEIYQAPPLQAFQQRLYPGFQSFFPYQYPPSLLPPTLWLGGFGFATAETIWTLAGIAALAAAAWLFFKPEKRWFGILALLASPAALLNGVAGETGFFSAALLLAGFALLPARPWLAGIAFGLLTLKPQLGLLIPIALLARGEVRAIAAACLTTAALMGLSCAMFPARLWPDWLHCLPEYQAAYLIAGRIPGLNSGISLAATLSTAGATPYLAWNLQATASLISAIAVFAMFRYGPYPLAVAALFSGMFLCAPHAFAYDTLPLVGALVLLQPMAGAEWILFAFVYLAPYLLLTAGRGWFIYFVPEALLFGSIIYLAIKRHPRTDTAHEPIPSAEPGTG